MKTPASASQDDALLDGLRAGDEDAFATLVRRHHGAMVRVAMLYAPSRAVAEEIVQESWIAVLKGVGGFEGRSSLKTWMLRVCANIARTRAEREGRSVPFSALEGPDEPAVPRDRFLPENHPRWPLHWSREPVSPEQHALSAEARAIVAEAIDSLPPAQRAVITLRDVHGWESLETCNVLGIAETNQRVLLHRARSKVRGVLEQYFEKEAQQ